MTVGKNQLDDPPTRRPLHKQSAGLGDGGPGGGPHNQRQGPRVAGAQAPSVPGYLGSSLVPLDPLKPLQKATKGSTGSKTGSALPTCLKPGSTFRIW